MQLNEIYRDAYNNLKETLGHVDGDEVTNPLLLHVCEDYSNADIRVMYFGQETNGWGTAEFPELDVDALLASYQKFYHDGGCWDYARPFWNCMRQLHQKVDAKFGSHKQIRYAWNNIVKVGERAGGCPSPATLKWQEDWFGIISKEVAILNPNVVIFFTGSDYDKFILQAFPDAKFGCLPGSERSEKELAALSHNGLPKIAIRTYHPDFLSRKKATESYLNEIISAIELGLIG